MPVPRGLQILLLGVALGTCRFAGAGEYRVYAPVVSVEPVHETRYEAVTREVCTGPDAARRDFTEVASTIGDDIRRQTRLWQQQRSCRTITEHHPRKHISGYRVTYRYRGHTATTRLARDPGERIPLDISLSPLP